MDAEPVSICSSVGVRGYVSMRVAVGGEKGFSVVWVEISGLTKRMVLLVFHTMDENRKDYKS